MSKTNLPWDTVRVDALKPDLDHVAVGSATVLKMERHTIMIVGSSRQALKNFLAGLLPIDFERFLIEHVAVVPADQIEFAPPPAYMDLPNGGGATQTGESTDAAAPQNDNVEQQALNELPVKNGESPFSHGEEPQKFEYSEDDDSL